MERLIGTLPITPRKDAPIGFFLAPYLVDILSRMTDSRGLVLINNLGLRANSNPEEQKLTSFNADIDSLIDLPTLMDSDTMHLDNVPNYINKCIENGLIRKENVSKVVCECGAVDIPSHVARELVMTRREGNTYFIQGDNPHCLVCGSEAVATNCEVLSLQFAEEHLPRQDFGIFPTNLTKEFNNAIQDTIERRWFITRSRQTGLVYDTEFGRFNFDVDFVWSLMNSSLMNSGVPISELVISHRSMAQASRFLVLSNAMDADVGRVIVLPFLHVRQDEKERSLDDNTNWWTDHYDTKIIRFFLGLGLQKNKEVNLNSALLYWISHSCVDNNRKLSTNIETETIDKVLNFLFSGGTHRLITYLRKDSQSQHPELSYLSSLYQAISHLRSNHQPDSK